jgi:hypothetical protein
MIMLKRGIDDFRMAHSIPKSQFNGSDAGHVGWGEGEADARHVEKFPLAIVWIHAVGGLQFAGQNLGMDDEHGNA